MKKVLGVVITKDVVNPFCWQSLMNQDYPNFDFIVSYKRPTKDDPIYIKKLYLNCSENRELARQLALANKEADYFLFIDSDIVVPTDAVTNFMKQFEGDPKKHILGGWYKMRNSPDMWVCGQWVKDNTFLNLLNPEPSLVKVDMVGMGCAIISRELLEKIHFTHGTDLFSKDALNPDGPMRFVGECGVFGNLVASLGYEMYMDGSVICQHL